MLTTKLKFKIDNWGSCPECGFFLIKFFGGINEN